MTKLVALLFAFLAIAAPARASSPFAGVWDGVWGDSGLQQSGKATLVIGPDGSVFRGTVTNARLGLDSPLEGTVRDDGQTSLTYRYSNAPITYRATGRLRMVGNRLSGVLDFAFANGTVFGHGTFTFARVPGFTPAIPSHQAAASAVQALEVER